MSYPVVVSAREFCLYYLPWRTPSRGWFVTTGISKTSGFPGSDAARKVRSGRGPVRTYRDRSL